MKKKVFGLFMILILASIQLSLAQRPIPKPTRPTTNTGQNPNQNREVIEGEEEEVEGRRSLLDDSTKMVYGPNTSLYFFEKDIKRNRLQVYSQDTSLTNYHSYDPVAKSGWKYHDLGNIGSAANPIFYEIPDVIGTRSGFSAYDLYYRAPENQRYFDTKSPFTNMSAFFGGGNRNMLDIEFARNINPRWNVGFEFHTIRSKKTLNPISRDDNMVEQNSYTLHTNYRSENGRYWFLGNFSRMNHDVREIGGIIPPEVDSTSLYFTYEDAKVWLRFTKAKDLRQDYHFYHEYKVKDGLQLYHIFDRKNQDVFFETNMNSSDSLYYPIVGFNERDTARNQNFFSEWKNEVGFKGTFGGFYYNAHAKFRSGKMRSPRFTSDDTFNEVFIGGELIGKISEKWSISADGEYLLPGAFRIHGLFTSPWLDVEYTKAVYKPTSMQQNFQGYFLDWTNDFENIGVDQIKGTVKVDFAKIRLRPSLTLNRVNNFVFFNTDREAEQATGEAFMIQPGVIANIQIGKKFRWDTELIFTQVTGAGSDAFRIPDVHANSRFYFDSPLFNNNVTVQMGIDVRYHSDYLANAYFTGTQQFNLQDNFNVYAYPVADFFLNFRINRTRVLLKYNHLNSGFMSQEGYFVTPDYTGYRSFLDLGITWYLFD